MKDRWYAAIAVLSVLVAGCSGASGPTVTFEGVVSVDGTPVDQGAISFTPVQSGAGKAVSVEIRDGRYRAENVSVGRTHVQFHAVRETGKMIHSNDPAEGGGAYPEIISVIPAKHQAGIDVTLTDTEKTRDFRLTTE